MKDEMLDRTKRRPGYTLTIIIYCLEAILMEVRLAWQRWQVCAAIVQEELIR